MKTISLSLSVALVATVLAGCASTRQNTAVQGRPPRLQVVVNVPPSMSALYEDEVSEAFGYRVASTLHEQGFRGPIHYVDRGQAPLPGVPVLAIDLIEWRVDRTGGVDCAFNATINNGANSKRLGILSGTSFMTWPRRDWYARADGFDEAARDAVTNLAARLERSGMIDRM